MSTSHYSRFLVIFALFYCFAQASWAKYVAVLETIADPLLKEEVSPSDKTYMTDVLRSEAVKMLPAQQNYTIMTRENINMMLPPGKTIEECEGSCLAETGKNIAADYVAQARIGKFGGTLTLSVELYETASNKLVSSFNGRGVDVNELLAVIKTESPSFFKAIKGSGSAFDGTGGFGDFSSGDAFSFQGNKKFVVEIVSEPSGAVPTVDGNGFSKCVSTPCKVQLDAGEHRFVISKDSYDDAESIVNVSENNQVISLTLNPNYGYLDIRPQLQENVGYARDLQISVDSKIVKPGIIDLDPGVHSILIRHPCYDPLNFKVSIVQGKTEIFDKSLVRGIGGLELDADYLGEPQAVPVRIDGSYAGSTPFSGEVPMCAKISVGETLHDETADVNLKWHEVVKYTHHFYHAPSSEALQKEKNNSLDSLKVSENASFKDSSIVGESIPAGTESGNSSIHWSVMGVSIAVALTGGLLAYIGESHADLTYKTVPSDASEYKQNVKELDKAQTLRTVGIITAIVGAVGFGVSFVF